MKFSKGDTVYFYNESQKKMEKGIIFEEYGEKDKYFINSLDGFVVLYSNPISSCKIIITEKNKNILTENLERIIKIQKLLLKLKNVMPL
jgi:hypothetical protein